MPGRPLAEERVETLGRRVYGALERGEELDRGADVARASTYRRAKWERARAALFELLRRLEKGGTP